MNRHRITSIYAQINQLSSVWTELTCFEDIEKYLNLNDNENLDLIAELYEDLKELV